MSVTYVKFCPHCETTNGVDAAICIKCGHKFRTQFQPPVSEKTVAMTGDALSQFKAMRDAEMPPPPTPVRRPRRFVRKFVFLAACGTLAFFALRSGSYVAHSVAPGVEKAAFQTYRVAFRSDAQGYPVPLATQSATDLRLYKADGADTVSVGLYHAGRIILVYPGTSAQVTEEGDGWRRVTLLSGARKGLSGFVGIDVVERPSNSVQNPGDALPPPPTSSNP